MYSESRQINNISGYKAHNEKLFLCANHTIFLNNEIIQTNIDEASLMVFNEKLFFTSNTEKKTYYFDEKVSEINFSSWLHTLFDSTVLIFEYSFQERLFKIFIYNFLKKEITNEVEKKISLWNLFRRNDFIYFYDYSKTILKSLSLLTGEYEWQTQINRNGEIFKILGVRKNELVVCWKRGIDYFALLGINIQTGEIVWNIDDNFLLNGLSLYFTPNQNSLFSTKGEDRNSYFIGIDLQNKQAKRYGEIPDLCKVKLSISSSLLKDELVYFTASTRHVFFPDTIGVFDYKTLKLLWKHTFDFDRNTHLKNIEVDGNKFYVLDSGGTLHIFERE